MTTSKGGARRLGALLSLALLASSLSTYTAVFAQADGEVQKGSVEQSTTKTFRLRRPGSPPPTNDPAPGSTPSDSSSIAPLTPATPSIDTSSFSTPPTSTTGSASTADSSSGSSSSSSTSSSTSNNIWRPGVILTGNLGEQALSATCDLSLAASQATEFPNSPEAAFIHAVALTKTSQVETALKEVRRARNLANATGDPNYFNRAVSEYEQSLEADPNNSCVRYGLSWAYYMQAYLLGERARKEEKAKLPPVMQQPKKKGFLDGNLMQGASILASVLTGTKPPANAIPHIPGALEGTPEWAVPQVKAFYAKSVAQLDEVIKREPTNAWAAVYRVHVQEEADGNATIALSKLQALKTRFPDNPAAAFFLADAYARNGNFAAGASSLGQAMKMKMEGK